ncbi:hypothetical protein [Bartonella sp. LJL80]
MKKIIKADAETLALLTELGEAQATRSDVAAVLKISGEALKDAFSRHPVLKATYDEAKAAGRMALRRSQLKLAQTNASMAVWLGKQYLGQRDKHEHSGPDGAPIQFERIEHVIIDPQKQPPEKCEAVFG